MHIFPKLTTEFLQLEFLLFCSFKEHFYRQNRKSWFSGYHLCCLNSCNWDCLSLQRQVAHARARKECRHCTLQALPRGNLCSSRPTFVTSAHRSRFRNRENKEDEMDPAQLSSLSMFRLPFRYVPRISSLEVFGGFRLKGPVQQFATS